MADIEPETCGVKWHKTPATADECLDRWLDEIQKPPHRGPGVTNYLYLTKRKRYLADFLAKKHPMTLYHVLIADWGGFQDAWECRWKEISGGWAKTRVLDERINGLIGHFVMRNGCALHVPAGRNQGWYTKENFVPWREK